MDDYYLMLEGSATSASNLEWFVTQFFDAEGSADPEQSRCAYDLCNELVGSIGPDDSNIVFLPFLYGSNVNPDAKGCFVGLESSHTRAHVLRAIYEGVVFTHLSHVDKLLKFRPLPEVIRLTGGAARSEVWLQIFSDIFQVPIETPEGTELGALGATIAASVAVGSHGSYEEAVQNMVRFSRLIEPSVEHKDVYARKYTRYKKLIETLDPVWTEVC
jgi:L-xylulokinase